jgi:A/G-specific adenine glycosylase
MLAQTQVSRVAERYPLFMQRFGTPALLAGVPLGEVLRLWQGLGYPRRAARLHECAAVVVGDYGGELPTDLASLLLLPGVGRYTARAVLAFAFDQPTMPIDTNIGRLLARFAGRSLRDREAQALGDAVLADAVLPTAVLPDVGGAPAALAFMDLGAMLCRPAQPRCIECPLQHGCSWGRARLSASGAIPPDPARGSARVSKSQLPFEGSDRQGRGRLLRAAAGAGITESELAAAAGWPGEAERAARAAASLVNDGLLAVVDGCYALP